MNYYVLYYVLYTRERVCMSLCVPVVMCVCKWLYDMIRTDPLVMKPFNVYAHDPKSICILSFAYNFSKNTDISQS